jgi:hypothetical protein
VSSAHQHLDNTCIEPRLVAIQLSPLSALSSWSEDLVAADRDSSRRHEIGMLKDPLPMQLGCQHEILHEMEVQSAALRLVTDCGQGSNILTGLTALGSNIHARLLTIWMEHRSQAGVNWSQSLVDHVSFGIMHRLSHLCYVLSCFILRT